VLQEMHLAYLHQMVKVVLGQQVEVEVVMVQQVDKLEARQRLKLETAARHGHRAVV
jgi:hypothetical protein